MSEKKNEPSQNNSAESTNNANGRQQTVNPPGQLASIAWYAILTAVFLAILYWIMQWSGIIKFEPSVTYFSEDQIVLSGELDDINSVLGQVNDVTFTLVDPQNDSDKIPDFLRPTNNQLNLQSQTELNDRNSNSKLQSQNIDTSIFLFRITFLNAETTIDDVVNEIQMIIQTESANVSFDLNYVIGRAPLEVEGDPDCSEGFAIADKTEIDGSDYGSGLFEDQWAFDNINLSSKPQGVDGNGVWVAMFDTSPFDLRGERLLSSDKPSVDFGNDVINHYEIISDPDARDHGIYGASLVHAVAPGTDIRFYRVLDQSNRGDLFTLLRALEALKQNWMDAGQPPLVINMSLGVHPSPDSPEAEALDILEMRLKEFYDAGAVIVAASGNDSAESYRNNSSRIAMQEPAAYSFVIGVGASNEQNGYSCFSNSGDILAPGGDNDDDCMSVVPSCADDSSSCLIGYVYTPDNAHYAYWTGTSFAAPMVSGAAALLLGQGIENKDVYRLLTPHLAAQIEGTSSEAATTVEPSVLDLAILANLDE